MNIRVTTRHCECFDIYTEMVDPNKSRYSRDVSDYAIKVTAFYEQIGVRSAMWTTPESDRPKYLEPGKSIEYRLEVDEARVVAYVDEQTWSDFLYGTRQDFIFSKTPMQYQMMSILIPTPIAKHEVKAVRRYRCKGGIEHYELAEEVFYSAQKPFVRLGA